LFNEKLANDERLESKYKYHQLKNNKYFNDYRECLIEPESYLLVSIVKY